MNLFINTLKRWFKSNKVIQYLTNNFFSGALTILTLLSVLMFGLVYQRLIFGPFWLIIHGVIMVISSIVIFIPYQMQIKNESYYGRYTIPILHLVLFGIIEFSNIVSVFYLLTVSVWLSILLSLLISVASVFLPYYLIIEEDGQTY